MKRVILLSVSILLISLAYSFAEVPCKINYQGRLIKDNVPVDGTKTMKFSIYDSAVGPTLLWTSEDVSVEVHNGLFRYVIGSDGGDLSSIDWTAGQALYLEVIVDGETLTPREELSAYPYAINSHLLEGETKEYFINTSVDAQTKQGNLNIIGNVGIGKTSPSEDLHVYRGDNDVARIYATGSSQGAGMIYVGQSPVYGGGIAYDGDGNPDIVGGNDRITFFRRSAGTDAEVFSYSQGNSNVGFAGNVGIGTTSPGAKLDVQGGAIKATGGLIIETRTSDPASPATGQMWLRTD